MGNIRLYGSTSGYTELAPPAVAPDGVLSLPSGTGTLLTAEGGKVLQVVRATDATNRSTTSTSFVDASLSVTITPQKSDSAILVLVFANATAANGTTSLLNSEYQITDNSNNAISGANAVLIGVDGYTRAATVNVANALSIMAYVTPATLSAVTYKLRFRSNNSATTTFLYNAQTVAQMFAIEVSA